MAQRDDDLRAVAGNQRAAAFAMHILRQDEQASRAVFSDATGTSEDAWAFATGLASMLNTVLSQLHGREFAADYLQHIAIESAQPEKWIQGEGEPGAGTTS